MKKIIIVLIVSLVLVTGCVSEEEINDPNYKTTEKEAIISEDKKKNNSEQYKTLNIEIDVKNKESNEGYMVYLVTPGKLKSGGAATQGGFLTPLETNKDGKVVLDLESNYNLKYFLEEEESTKKDHLQVVVATKEDKYLRNPLNEEFYIEFKKNQDDDIMTAYVVPEENYKVDVIDKYPDGVLSLTFPEATFVIKFDGTPKDTAYEVTIHRPNEDGTGLGMYSIGRINRAFQYWDTPFFEDDIMRSWGGTIIVKDFDTNERVMYEGYPKTVAFDENGKCTEGDIVTIKLIE